MAGALLVSDLAGPLRARKPGGPLFFLASRAQTRVYLLGFGEAKDRSWLTAPIERAFHESTDLWLEGPGPNPKDEDPAAKQAAADRMDQLGRETGRTLFDALEPPVRDRTLAYLSELGIPRDSVAPFRPWKAYYSIVSAFMSKRTVTTKPVFPDAVLSELARAQGKPIGYELPTREAFATWIAGMSDKEQSQYMAWLLDFLDDYKKGLNGDDETFGWTRGENLPTGSLDRMRTEMPDLYSVMQIRRNAWWADKVAELLQGQGTHFVAVGQLHLMGPDGIPRQLERRGLDVVPAAASWREPVEFGSDLAPPRLAHDTNPNGVAGSSRSQATSQSTWPDATPSSA